MTHPAAMKIASLLQQAVALHQKGKFGPAQDLYQQVLQLDADQFDALHLMGVLARQEGRAERAVELISQAIGINPSQASAHCNLGAALQDVGRTEDALASYERAVELDPGYALAFSNRGNTLRKLGRQDEALTSYDRALQMRPTYPEAWCNRAILLNDLGRGADALTSAERALSGRANYAEALCARGNALQVLNRFGEAVHSYDRAILAKSDFAEAHCARGTALQRLQRLDAALQSYDRALELRSDYPEAHQFRGNTLRSLARTSDAIAAYQQALAQGGNEAQLSFALAALGVGSTPSAMPGDYVTSLFDQYAEHFDEHLTGVLAYKTPAFVDAAIRRHIGAIGVDTIDLGCGTGLCGPYLRPYSRSLVGVDLSEKMLEKARERKLYDGLECAELVAFLSGQVECCDLIVAADVFVYIGDLRPAFSAAHDALRPNGLFCFSVEAGDDDDFALQPSNRFAHSLAYLQRIAGTAGFEIIEAERQFARQEKGADVVAYVVVARRRNS